MGISTDNYMHFISVINKKIAANKKKESIIKELMNDYKMDKNAAEYAYSLAIEDKNVNVK